MTLIECDVVATRGTVRPGVERRKEEVCPFCAAHLELIHMGVTLNHLLLNVWFSSNYKGTATMRTWQLVPAVRAKPDHPQHNLCRSLWPNGCPERVGIGLQVPAIIQGDSAIVQSCAPTSLLGECMPVHRWCPLVQCQYKQQIWDNYPLLLQANQWQ